MWQLKDSKENSVQSKIENGNVLINDKELDVQFNKMVKDIYEAEVDGQKHKVELLSYDATQNLFELKINQKPYSIQAKGEAALFLEKMGINIHKKAKLNVLNAPMPGLILSLNVEVGSQVSKGDSLLILEAMKMENIIKASGDGIVKSIEVTQGNNVEKGQKLITFE